MNGYPSILHIITSESWGGLETYVHDLIVHQHSIGMNVGVYCLPGSIIKEKLSSKGLVTHAAFKRSKFSVRDIFQVSGVLKKHKYEIIHTHTNKDMWLGSMTMIFNDKCKQVYSLYMSVTPKLDLIHRYVFSKVNFLVSSSEIINDEVMRKYPIDSKRIKLIRYGREIDEYTINGESRKNIRKKWGANDGEIVVGTMCRIDSQKGVKEFVESFLALKIDPIKKVQFWLIGDRTIKHLDKNGEYVYEKQANETYEYINDFISRNNLSGSIKIIPYQADLINYLSAIDFFVLASYNEMYALVILDAMLMQIPVIGTNRGGTTEQLGNDERGVLVEPNNTAALAERISYCISHRRDLEPLIERGRNWVLQEQHDWKSVPLKYLTLYKECLA